MTDNRGGHGGASIWGGGGRGGLNTDGSAGRAYGSGGSDNSVGKAGIVLVEW